MRDLLPHPAGRVSNAGDGLAISDTEPKSGVRSREFVEMMSEPFAIPPVGTGLTEASREDLRIPQSDEGRGQSPEAGTDDEMIPGSERRIAMTHPGNNILDNEPGKSLIAGQFAMTGRGVEVGEKENGKRWNGALPDEPLDDAPRVHAVEVELRIEKDGHSPG